ncbi:MAG: alpha/beta hydrolase [Deltaproteobacteria bacterium]|nr:alpha/beta hydrolase [Deltaproteobacteria bacterium]
MLTLLIAFPVITVSACAISRKVIFPGNRRPVGEKFPIKDAQKQSFQTLQGDLVDGVFLPGKNVSPASPGPVVFFAHGNGESIDNWGKRLNVYREQGISVAMFEYRGYGRSEGQATQENLVSDGIRFYDLISARKDVNAQKVIFHGRSLGTGILVQLLLSREAHAVILQNSFANLSSLAWRYYAPPFFIFDDFDSESALKKLAQERRDPPLLLLHGKRDSLFNVDEHPALLEKAARNAQLKIFDCGHNNCSFSEFFAEIRSFLDAPVGILQASNDSTGSANANPAPHMSSVQ